MFPQAAPLHHAVSQISVLPVTLFIIYTLRIGNIARSQGLNVHFPADDIQLYVAFDPNEHKNTTSVFTVVGKIHQRNTYLDGRKQGKTLTPKLQSSQSRSCV